MMKDPRDAASERVLVIGTSCSGKSTFARELARLRGLPWVEMDALFWGPNWAPRPADEFRRSVAQAAAGEGWIIEGNYGSVRDVLWPRATIAIWLDYPLRTVLTRGLRRTVRRVITAEPLWHGNTESFRHSFLSKDSILVWILNTHARRKREFEALRVQGTFPQLHWTVLPSPRAAGDYLAQWRV